MGQYGGGVEGKFAVAGLMCRLAVLGVAVVGGLVTRVVVGTVGGGTTRAVVGGVVAGGRVIATLTTVVGTGVTVVVVRRARVVVGSDVRAACLDERGATAGEATTRGEL
jgi:hypothetical protein